MKRSFFFIIFFCFTYNTTVHAQLDKNNCIHFTVKDGLPSSTIYRISQDRNGFIWIATEAGLSMYDGSSFKNYTTKDGLPDNELLSLFCDSLNRTWIIPYKKNPAYVLNYKIHNEENDSLIGQIARINMEEFISGNNTSNNTWLFKTKLYKLGSNSLKQVPLLKPLETILYVEDINKDSSIIYTTGGFFLLSRDIITLLPFADIPYSNGYIQAISRSGNLLQVCCSDGFYIYEKNGLLFKLLKELPYLHPHKKIFIGPIIGNDFYYALAGEKMICIKNMLGDSIKIIETPIHANDIFADEEKNIWVSSADDGIYFYPAKKAITLNAASGLLSDNIQNVFVNSKKDIYLGNSKGAWEKIDVNGKITIINDPPQNRFIQSRGISGNDDFTFMLNDLNFGRFSLADHKLEFPYRLTTSPKSFFFNTHTNNILIGDLVGFATINNADFGHIKYVPLQKRITAVCETAAGQLFYGSTDGLYEYKNNSSTYLGNEWPLLKCRITSIASDNYNIIWVATSSNGIYAFKKNKIVYRASADDDLSFIGNMCRAVKIIDGKVWIATNAGIDCISYTGKDTVIAKSINSYSVNDGLPSDDINDVFVKDSFLYAATNRGLGILNYMATPASQQVPVYITEISIDNNSTDIKTTYDLAYDQNNLNIKYAGVWFHPDGEVKYRYRLQGKDSAWTYTKLNSLQLLSLEPGTYHVQIQASTKNNFLNCKSADVFFKITPPYYATWWFRSLVTLIMAGLLVLGIAFLFRKRNMRRVQIETLNNEVKYYELEALRSQMNPHFIFNSLTAVQHFININDAENANKYIAEFAKLIRKTLNNSRESFITLDKEIQYLENYISLEQMRFLHNFDFDIHCDESFNKFTTKIPCMLLQPYVENAIRHGIRPLTERRGYIEIKFIDDNDFFTCIIDDNGIGRIASALFNSEFKNENESKGMLISEDRIKTLNSLQQPLINIEVKDKENNSGTRIIFTFYKLK